MATKILGANFVLKLALKIKKKEGMKLKILAVGDIVGSAGINELKLKLKEIKEKVRLKINKT